MDLRLEIEITSEDLQLIVGGPPIVAVNTFCPDCRKVRLMSVSEYWLNHIGDVTLEGKCSICARPLSHYLDTGVSTDGYDQAMAIRELKMEVLGDYRARPYKPQQY